MALVLKEELSPAKEHKREANLLVQPFLGHTRGNTSSQKIRNCSSLYFALSSSTPRKLRGEVSSPGSGLGPREGKGLA